MFSLYPPKRTTARTANDIKMRTQFISMFFNWIFVDIYSFFVFHSNYSALRQRQLNSTKPKKELCFLAHWITFAKGVAFSRKFLKIKSLHTNKYEHFINESLTYHRQCCCWHRCHCTSNRFVELELAFTRINCRITKATSKNTFWNGIPFDMSSNRFYVETVIDFLLFFFCCSSKTICFIRTYNKRMELRHVVAVASNISMKSLSFSLSLYIDRAKNGDLVQIYERYRVSVLCAYSLKIENDESMQQMPNTQLY